MIFHFVVHHLHGLARVPLAPQFFDALLLTWTALFHGDRFAALEKLEAQALQLSGVGVCSHRYGGIGFKHGGREFAHIHGNGLLDVHLTHERAEEVMGMAEPHHLFGRSAWVSFWVRSVKDLATALLLLQLGSHQIASFGSTGNE